MYKPYSFCNERNSKIVAGVSSHPAAAAAGSQPQGTPQLLHTTRNWFQTFKRLYVIVNYYRSKG